MYEGETEKTPQQFADCALPKMVDLQADTHAMKDGDAVVILTPVGNRGASIAGTITATPTPTGSHIALRNSLGGKAKKPWEAVQSCM